MTLRSKAAAAAGAAMMFASPALADIAILMRVGAWEAFGGKTRSGIPVCGVAQDVNDRYFSLKIFGERPFLVLQMGSKEWAKLVVDQATTPMTLRFDGNPPWTGDGIGMHFEDGAGALEITFDKDLMDELITQFRRGNRLSVKFGNTSMAEWAIQLAGTNAVTEAFLVCARKLG
jgi:hypothetical protein